MENGIVKPMLRSLLISYVLSGILLAALAFALYKLRLKEGQVNLMVYAVYLLTCLCGGFLRFSGGQTHPAAPVLLGASVRASVLPGAFCSVLGHEYGVSH